MPHGTKIATCCYCGSRAALVLRGETRHELACASCGAPLHDLKRLRSDAVTKSPPKRDTRRPKPAKARKQTSGKGGLSRFFEEAWDVIEDIFD